MLYNCHHACSMLFETLVCMKLYILQHSSCSEKNFMQAALTWSLLRPPTISRTGCHSQDCDVKCSSDRSCSVVIEEGGQLEVFSENLTSLGKYVKPEHLPFCCFCCCSFVFKGHLQKCVCKQSVSSGNDLFFMWQHFLSSKVKIQ